MCPPTDSSLGGYGILPYPRRLLWDIIFSHGIRRIHRTSCRGGLPRISQICTDVRVRCSPTEFTEFTEPPTEMSSHGFHRFTQILRVRCSPTEFGSVGMAGMPYPPTSVLICVICGRFFSARSFRVFRAFCGNLFPPTDFTDLHRCLGCALFPRNPQNPQNLAAWVWQGCHTLLHL